jgi:hypothetical protein
LRIITLSWWNKIDEFVWLLALDSDLVVDNILGITLRNFIVLFYVFAYWYNTVFVADKALFDVVSLKFGKDLNNSLLKSGSSHKLFILRSCESLLPDLNSLNWLHLVPDLVILTSQELSSHSGLQFLFVRIIKDKDVALLSEFYQVEHFNARKATVEIVMEVLDIFVCKSA